MPKNYFQGKCLDLEGQQDLESGRLPTEGFQKIIIFALRAHQSRFARFSLFFCVTSFALCQRKCSQVTKLVTSGLRKFSLKRSKKRIFLEKNFGSWLAALSPIEGQRDIKKRKLFRVVSTTEHKSPRSYGPFTYICIPGTTLRTFLCHLLSFAFHSKL